MVLEKLIVVVPLKKYNNAQKVLHKFWSSLIPEGNKRIIF